MNILLSKKHGLNPSITACFWCGKDIGLALCGRMKGDAKAPRRIVVDYEPCDECKEKFKLGIHMIECTNHPTIEGQASLNAQAGPAAYPTGRWCVIKKDAALRLFSPEVHGAILKAGAAFVDRQMYAMIFVNTET